MEKHCTYKVGDKIKVTYPTKFPNHVSKFRVIDLDIQDPNEWCTIKLEYISQIDKFEKLTKYKKGERFILVEDQWFNQELTERCIIKIK